MYTRLRTINDWTDHFVPNASGAPALTEPSAESSSLIQRIEEWVLRGKAGDRLEAWEMERKIRRFSRQADTGAETQFDADTCQGNFNNHGNQTRRALHDRLVQLGIESPIELPASQSNIPALRVGENTIIGSPSLTPSGAPKAK